MEPFSPEELVTKNAIQIKMMEIFGYVNKKMDAQERVDGAAQWSAEDGGENARMAKIFSDICHRPKIRAKLSSGVSDSLIAEIKFEIEKMLYPELFHEQSSVRAI